MCFRRYATFALFALISIPGSLRAQDDAATTARYDAAIEWMTWIEDSEFEKAAAQVNESVAAQMTPASLEQTWGEFSPRLGSLLSLEPKGQGMERGFHQVILTGVFANRTVDVTVYMAADHTVTDFSVTPAR